MAPRASSNRRPARRRLAAALLIAAAIVLPWRLLAGERMTSVNNDMARSAVGGAGGTSGAATSSNRLDAAFGEEIAGSSVAATANRLAPGFVQIVAFPGTVTDLAAPSAVFASSVALQWTAPGLDGAWGALAAGSSYYIRVASYTVPDTFTSFSDADIVFSTAGTSPGATVSTSASGLQPNTTYWTRLWTKDPAGGLSYASSISTFVTLALPVTLQSESFVAVHFTSVAAQWVPRPSLLQDVSSMTAEGYRVEASSTNFGALAPGGVISSSETTNVTLSTLTVSDPGLVFDRTYYFRAGSLNHAGVANWTVLGSTKTRFQVNEPVPGDPPYASLSTGSMTARWDRNGNSADTAYHAEASKTFDFSGIVTATDTYNLFYSSGGLDANTTYYFRVYATTRAVSSAFASLGSTMTWAFAPAGAPAPFVAVHESSLTVRWLHNGNGSGGVSTYSVVATTSPAYPNTDAGNRVLVSTVPGGTDPMAAVTGLAVNTTYYLFGAGVNRIGAQGGFALLGSTATRPTAAAVVVYDEVSFSSAVPGWLTNGNPLGVTTFTVTLSTVAAYPPGGAWDVSLSTVPGASPVLLPVSGLRLNATYHLFVTAVGHAHSAFAVGESSATMAAPPGASPDAGTYEPVTTTAFTVNWSSGAAYPGYDALSPRTTYYADIAVNPTFSPVLASSRTFNLSAPFAGLSINTTYYARVAAFSHHHGALTAYADFGSSATLAAVPVAGAPTFVAVQFTSATVAWGGNGNPVDVTTYTVVFSSGYVYPNELPDNIVLDTAPAGAALSATIEGLASNTTYTFFVRAINHKGAETAWANLGSTRTLFSPKTWTGATNSLWNTATNWNPNGVPSKTDAVTIGIAANVSAIGAQISFSSLTLGSPAGTAVALTFSTTIADGGSVLIYKNAGLTQATTRQLVIAGDFTMVSGSSLSHTSESATSISSVNIRVTGKFDLQAGSTISLMGRGYRGGPVDTAGFGPGAGGTDIGANEGGGGAGYGGAGGIGDGAPGGAAGPMYGSLTAPINMGSGGGGSGLTGTGGAGGGVAIINAGEMLLNGVILSSGATGRSVPPATTAAGGGGGSGGGVFITAVDFSGNGSIDVRGGPGGSDDVGPGGGGGGGRASIVITGSGVSCLIAVSTAGGVTGGPTAVAGTSGTFSASDLLAAPQNFTGAAASATSISWTWSLTNGATDYQVFSSTGGPMSPPLGSADNYTTTGLAINTTASFYVQARACGANVANSAAKSVSTLAQIPAALASPAFTQVNMSSMSVAWAANGNPVNVTSFTVVLTTEAAFPNADEGNVSLSTFPAGASLAATLDSLFPNTTFFLFVAAKNHAGLLTSYVDLATSAATRALPPAALAEPFLNVGFSSAAAAWGAFAPPPQSSSASAQGYVLEASSTNFGALTPGGAVYSSTTWNVRLSTLTVAISPIPAHLCVPHYFRVGSLNWSGLTNFTTLGSTRAVDDYGVVVSTQDLDIGGIDVNTEIVISTSLLVSNVGCPVTYQIKVTTITPGSPWVVSTTSGTDAFTVQALFNSVQPASAAFDEIDKLTDAAAASTATKFAGDQNGAAVPVTTDLLLWFKLGMPRFTSTADSQQIRVTVIAIPP